MKYKRLATAGPDLDSFLIKMDSLHNLRLCIAACTGVEKLAESELIFRRPVDVGDPQLRLPQERVIRTFENLPLLRDRFHGSFKRGASIHISKRSRLYLRNNLKYSAADRPEVLDPFGPKDQFW
jgi:hypothetical protein